MNKISIIGALLLMAGLVGGQADATVKKVVPAKKVHNIMVVNGLKLLNTPYVAHTLEVNSPEEKMVVNLKGVDCTTFVEYTLARSLCKRQGDSTQFLANLQRIRYRNGKLDGYTSRLHYSTEWALNGIRNGYLTDEAASHSKDTIHVNVFYMSKHPNAYKQLAVSPDNVKVIAAKERELSKMVAHYVPKGKLPAKGFSWIHDGDIIMLVTSIPGLDNSHLGIAFYNAKGELHLLHASSAEGKVKIQEEPLCEQLATSRTNLGIRVFRMKK